MPPFLQILPRSLCLILLLSFYTAAHAQGKVYGMTAAGGASNAGVLYSVNSDGTNYTVLYSFLGGSDGAAPGGTVVMDTGSQLYGLTTSGGSNNAGTVFAYDTATQTYKKLADFSGANGSGPVADLVWFNNKFYGLTPSGGANGVGTVFCYDPSAGTLTDQYDLTLATGANPAGDLVVVDNMLYFFTNTGGANGGGTIEGFDPVAQTVYDLYNFPPLYAPAGPLVVMNSIIYGTTFAGGGAQHGNVFSFNPLTTTYRDIYDFNEYPQGFNPVGITAFNGVIYGTVQAEGPNNAGLLFSLDPVTRVFTTLYIPDPVFSPSDGINLTPTPRVTPAGLLLGTARFDGTGYGTIYSYDLNSNQYTTIFQFANSNGAFPTTGQLLLPPASGVTAALTVKTIRNN